tara:strand:+ start:172 stop:474 length:303 start_codon:yes stop_codon:yes gene_type:complete
MAKLTEKKKDLIYSGLIKKTTKKIDLLMNSIEKDPNFKKLNIEIGAFADVVIRDCSYLIADKYCIHKLKDTFQRILEDIANGDVIEAKQTREEILNNPIN